jgi:hypothetical protein
LRRLKITLKSNILDNKAITFNNALINILKLIQILINKDKNKVNFAKNVRNNKARKKKGIVAKNLVKT